MAVPVILFQAPNGVGLGHINRMATVALAVRQRRPDALLPFVLQGGSHMLLEEAKLTYISLPDGPMFFAGQTYSRWGATIVLAASRVIIHGIAPDLIVCDTIPNQVFLTAAAEMNVPIAVCARKTKDDAAYFRMLDKFDAMLHLLIIPHNPGEVNVPPHFASRARFVGNIVRPAATAIPRHTTLGSQQLLITGGGGGADGTLQFYNFAMESFARYRQNHPNVDCVLIAGPLFEKWWDLRITEHVRVIPSVPELRDLLGAVDLVLCQAGYNTVSEIIQVGVPCLCLPGRRGFDDQLARANEAAKSNPSFSVYQGQDPDELSDLIDGCLKGPRPTAERNPFRSDGAQRAADLLLDFVTNSKVCKRTSSEGHAQQVWSAAQPSRTERDDPMGSGRDPSRVNTWGKTGRNELCPCGSGKKHKYCHGRAV